MAMVIIATIVVVIVPRFESHTLGDKSEEEDLGKHVDGCEDSCGIVSQNFNTTIYTTQQVNSKGG